MSEFEDTDSNCDMLNPCRHIAGLAANEGLQRRRMLGRKPTGRSPARNGRQWTFRLSSLDVRYPRCAAAKPTVGYRPKNGHKIPSELALNSAARLHRGVERTLDRLCRLPPNSNSNRQTGTRWSYRTEAKVSGRRANAFPIHPMAQWQAPADPYPKNRRRLR